jgi:hypothetical protein
MSEQLGGTAANPGNGALYGRGVRIRGNDAPNDQAVSLYPIVSECPPGSLIEATCPLLINTSFSVRYLERKYSILLDIGI